MPHQYTEDLLPRSGRLLGAMQNFAGLLEYLCRALEHLPKILKAGYTI